MYSFLKLTSIILIFVSACFVQSEAQSDLDLLLTPADTLNIKRQKMVLFGTSAFYMGTSIFLYNAWYKNYDQEAFHLFDDNGEWQNMDKWGHVYSTYHQSWTMYDFMKWTGSSDRSAINTGLISGLLIQSTIEIMDGFSSKWGFSIADMAANVSGSGLFFLQQRYFGHQYVTVKFNSTFKTYPNSPIFSKDAQRFSSLEQRTNDLFGDNALERLLKDYNAQQYWLCFDMDRLIGGDNRWPKWLDIGIGYSGENMFGGFDNTWTEEESTYSLDNSYERYGQYYLGIDIDLQSLHFKSPILNTLKKCFRIIKIPAPAIGYSNGNLKFHAFR